MKTIPRHTIDIINQWLELQSKHVDTPGFSILIAKDGEILLKQGYGYANLETKEKMTTDHIFRIASQSKMFTSTAIMQLQESGKLRIDDYVVKYLSWLDDHKDIRWKHVTIRQLLSHSAGIIRDGVDSDYWQLTKPFPNEQEIRDAILQSDLIINPNSKLKYSNFGYGLLGQIISNVSSYSYNDYVTEHIIKPLGLQNTTPEFDTVLSSKFATGYSKIRNNKDRFVFNHVDTKSLSPATGFCSNVEDMFRFLSAQMVGSEKLISDESKREIQRMQWKASNDTRNYGLGFTLSTKGNRKFFGHGGGFPGYITHSLVDSEDGLMIVVQTNAHNGESASAINAIVDIIDKLGEKEPNTDLLKFEGWFACVDSVDQIIVNGDSLISIAPESWTSFNSPNELERIDQTTLKLVKTSNYSSEGELVKYMFNDDGSVNHIIYTGTTMLPSTDGDSLLPYEL